LGGGACGEDKGERSKDKGKNGRAAKQLCGRTAGKLGGWKARKPGGGKAAPSAALGVRGEERVCP
jgi:hypothetical protein